MPVMTLIGHTNASNKTGAISFRGGAIVLDIGEYADLTVEEINWARQLGYILAEGIQGPPGQTLPRSSLILAQLGDVAEETIEEGKGLIRGEEEWFAVPLPGLCLHDGDNYPARPSQPVSVFWIGPEAPTIGGVGNAIDGQDVWINTSP